MRDEKEFFDITLACEDRQLGGAHMVILSSPSPKTNIQTHLSKPDDPPPPPGDCILLHSYTKKYGEQFLRNKIVPRNKYCCLLFTNPNQKREKSQRSFCPLGWRPPLSSSSQSEGASSQVMIVTMIS